MTYTTPKTLVGDINKIINRFADQGNDVATIEIDEHALKFFTKQFMPDATNRLYSIGEFVGSYRGKKVFCGFAGSIVFFNVKGHDLARLSVSGFKELDMDLELVFDKLKDVLDLGSDADELDVLIEVIRLVEGKPAPVHISWPHTIGDPIPAPTVKPWVKEPTITWNATDSKIPEHLLKRKRASVEGVVYNPWSEDIYDASN